MTALTLAPPVALGIGNRHVETLTEGECEAYLAPELEEERVLVFAPHPDDDVLGCGGQIIEHVAHGNRVWIVYCSDTRGVGVFGMPEYDRLQLSEILAMAEAVCPDPAKYFLGVKVGGTAIAALELPNHPDTLRHYCGNRFFHPVVPHRATCFVSWVVTNDDAMTHHEFFVAEEAAEARVAELRGLGYLVSGPTQRK